MKRGALKSWEPPPRERRECEMPENTCLNVRAHENAYLLRNGKTHLYAQKLHVSLKLRHSGLLVHPNAQLSSVFFPRLTYSDLPVLRISLMHYVIYQRLLPSVLPAFTVWFSSETITPDSNKHKGRNSVPA